MASFVRESIRFAIPSKFEHKKKLNTDIYISDNYIYDFYFNMHIKSKLAVQSIYIEKNGQKYTGLNIQKTAFNEYVLTESEVIRKTNVSYLATVTLVDGSVATRFFYVKVRNCNDNNDIVFNSLATYGLHENFTNLKILADVSTDSLVDRIELYYKSSMDDDFLYLGDMAKVSTELDTSYRYEYDYLIFKMNFDKIRHVIFKAKVFNVMNHTKSKSIEVILLPATFSINSIITNYNTNETYGGVTCKVIHKLNRFKNKTFMAYFSTVNNDKFFKLVCDNYTFYADNIKIVYPTEYNKNRSDSDPNIYTLSGKGRVQYIDDVNTIYDTASFNATFICGETIKTELEIDADNNNDLTFVTEETVNSIIKYSIKGESNELTVLDGTYEDETIESSETITNILIANNDKIEYIDINNPLNLPVEVPNKRSSSYIEMADKILYNNEVIYYINFLDSGINYVRSDGFNYDTYYAKINLYPNVLTTLNHYNFLKFDTEQNLVMNFYNFDNQQILQRVNIVNDDVTIIDYSDNLDKVFTALDANLMKYLNDSPSGISNTREYQLTIKNQLSSNNSFIKSGLDNFVQNFVVVECMITKTFKTDATYYVATKGGTITSSIVLTAFIKANVKFTDDGYTIENYSSYLQGTCNDDSFYNELVQKSQRPANLMEHSLGNYYIKFETAVTSTTINAYDQFKKCAIYMKSIKICDMPLTAADFITRKYYNYADFSKIMLIVLSERIVVLISLIDNVLYLTYVNILLNEVVQQVRYDTKAIFNKFLTLKPSKLALLEYIFNGINAFETTSRDMKIFITTDVKYSIGIYNLEDYVIIPEQQDDFSYEKNDNSLSYSYVYSVDWPLNVKNRNNYLVDLRIHQEQLEFIIENNDEDE